MAIILQVARRLNIGRPQRMAGLTILDAKNKEKKLNEKIQILRLLNVEHRKELL